MANLEEIEEILFDIISLLDQESIPYAVMGGLAIRVYSIPRATQDVDITIAIDHDQLDGFRESLSDLGYSIPAVYDSGWLDRVADMPLFKIKRHIDTYSVDVDIFIAESRFQDSMLQRRLFVEVSGRRIALVSPEDLLLLKLVAARPRDLIDVQDLLFSMGTLDESYLRKWAAELGIVNGLEHALRKARE
jgi:predicted nucleotidyltransferase